MQYEPQPLNPPIGYNPIEEYHRDLDKQGEQWINGGIIDEIVVTPKSYQFDWIKKVPKELRDKIYSNLKDSDWIINENPWSNKYFDFLDRHPGFNNLDELAHYLWTNNNSNYSLNSKDDKYHRLIELWSKYPYKVKFDGIDPKRGYARHQGLKKEYGNISDLKELVAEIAHPYQRDFGKVPKWQHWPQHYERKFREFIFPKSDERYHHVYETPGYFEHETHKIIQPQLFDYIWDGTPLKFINKNSK